MKEDFFDKTTKAIENVYKRYAPWDIREWFKKDMQWGPPLYIPLDIEADFRSQVYANLISQKNGNTLLSKNNDTCVLHAEVGVGWVNGIESILKKPRYSKPSAGRKITNHMKLDLAFVDVGRHSPPFEEAWGNSLGDACRDVKLNGAVELKRNFNQGLDNLLTDLNKLRAVADAMRRTHTRNFWAIFATTAFWYGPSGTNRKETKENFEAVLKQIRALNDEKYRFRLRSYHANKAAAQKSNRNAIITEDSTIEDLDYTR
ncbi:MAG: hypothetical protein ACLPY5_04010 [Candidatus Bathyarchaeia archaeon]